MLKALAKCDNLAIMLLMLQHYWSLFAYVLNFAICEMLGWNILIYVYFVCTLEKKYF